jgi:hypothetical protein
MLNNPVHTNTTPEHYTLANAKQSSPHKHNTRTLYVRLLSFSTVCFGRYSKENCDVEEPLLYHTFPLYTCFSLHDDGRHKQPKYGVDKNNNRK